jgi:adenine deaminase
MMTPASFADAVVPLGTVAAAADPHEIGNVLGTAGVKMLCDLSRDLPLDIHVMAPSTIPSAPGFETSGASIGAAEIREMLGYEGILGLGELMDFNGVIAGDSAIMEIIREAKKAGVLLDGHGPLLKGKELQAFAASGIDSDHTYMDPKIAEEKLRCGMWVQIQESFLSSALMAFLSSFPVQNRVCLVTDDVPVTRLGSRGHLDAVIRKAIALGLPPVKAIRYATINPADRLRLYSQGAVAPGRRADMLLLSDLQELAVEEVFVRGRLCARKGRMLSSSSAAAAAAAGRFPPGAYNTVKLPSLSEEDFAIPVTGAPAGEVQVNAIEQNGKTSRTKQIIVSCKVRDGKVLQGKLMKMAVFERYSGRAGRSLGLIANTEGFRGAMATTYAHDCHNLIVYSADDSDAALAANTLIGSGGGVAAVLDGEILSSIALPIGGILCEDSLETLSRKFDSFLAAAKTMGLNHEEPLSFLCLMALAVSPEIKLTDRGLLDVMKKQFIPLIRETGGAGQ